MRNTTESIRKLIYNLLWQKEKNYTVTYPVLVPDTIEVTNGMAALWYFMENGFIRKKYSKSVSH